MAHGRPAARAEPARRCSAREFPRLQDEKPQNLCQYAGKVVRGGQHRQLLRLHAAVQGAGGAAYAATATRGLVVLGFPSNDFGAQEPGSSKEIADVLREHLRRASSRCSPRSRVAASAGATPTRCSPTWRRRTGQAPRWNFHKYLIARDGSDGAAATPARSTRWTQAFVAEHRETARCKVKTDELYFILISSIRYHGAAAIASRTRSATSHRRGTRTELRRADSRRSARASVDWRSSPVLCCEACQLSLAEIPGGSPPPSLLPPSPGALRSNLLDGRVPPQARHPRRGLSHAARRRHRLGHLRPGRRPRPAGPGAGHAVRGRRLLRRPHAHGRRHARRRARTASTPASWSSTSAPTRSLLRLFERARRRDRAVGHVVLGAGARQRRSSGAAATSTPCSRSARNLLRPRFWRMLARHPALQPPGHGARRARRARPRWPSRSATSSREHRFGDEFRDWYFLPMIGCIWSCPTDQMLRFPVATHDPLLPQPRPDPGDRTGRSGTRCAAARGTTSQKMVAGVARRAPEHAGAQRAARAAGQRRGRRVGRHRRAAASASTRSCWPATATRRCALLADASAAERGVLGAIRYHPNRAVLHTDTAVLPRRGAAWAAWNYERAADDAARAGRASACTT